MVAFHLTPENAEEMTGCGQSQFEFDGHRRVLNARHRVVPFGNLAFARPLRDAVPIIPRDEWVDRIREKDASQSWLRNINDRLGVAVQDQDGRGWCHGFGTVAAAETALAVGGKYTALSGESVAGPVTGWQDEGANPEDDLEQLVKFGACPLSFVIQRYTLNPRSGMKAGWEEAALDFTAAETYDLDPDPRRMFAEQMSAVLQDFATGAWYNWWSHHIQGFCQAKYDEATRTFWGLPRNNWGASYGDDGYFWAREGYGKGLGTASGAFAVRVMNPNGLLLPAGALAV